LKDDKDKKRIFDYLFTQYARIKDTYKHFSVISNQTEVPSIAMNSFTEFINQTEIIDGRTLKLADIDLLFITTKSSSTKHPLNPDRALVRYQFMEILVRIALDKFLKHRVCENPLEALQRLFDEKLISIMDNYAIHNWRELKMWSENCDTVFKAYLPILKDIYKRYSGSKVKPG
jgi:Ni,Fe-hydrogenase I cytochrome b subunit